MVICVHFIVGSEYNHSDEDNRGNKKVQQEVSCA